MKIETPGCTNLVLPIKQKNKKDQHFVLRDLELTCQTHTEICKSVHGKRQRKWMCGQRGGVLGAENKV